MGFFIPGLSWTDAMCYLGRMQEPLSQVLQIVRDRYSSLTLITSGPSLPSAHSSIQQKRGRARPSMVIFSSRFSHTTCYPDEMWVPLSQVLHLVRGRFSSLSHHRCSDKVKHLYLTLTTIWQTRWGWPAIPLSYPQGQITCTSAQQG